MSDYKNNIEAMAKSLALMLAPIVVLSEDDCISSDNITELQEKAIAVKMAAEYLNDIEIPPALVRKYGIERIYTESLITEFYNHISDSCEQWIRRIQIEDAK